MRWFNTIGNLAGGTSANVAKVSSRSHLNFRRLRHARLTANLIFIRTRERKQMLGEIQRVKTKWLDLEYLEIPS